METGYEFMMKVLAHPVCDAGEALVSLPEALRGTGIEVVFFRRQRIPGHRPIFRLRAGLVKPWLSAAEAMNRHGWRIRIEDGYRTRSMQNPLNRPPALFDAILRRLLWETEGRFPSPEFVFRRLTVLVTTIPKLGTHMSGSAMDISVLKRKNGEEVDRGAPYLEMSELTPMASPYAPAAARRNRAGISRIMAEHGFAAYPFEFWHYSGGDAYAAILSEKKQPARYGPVDLLNDSGRIRPIDNPALPLINPVEIQAALSKAARRLGIKIPAKME